MPPLSLTSKRWKRLKAHFDNAYEDTDVPAVPTLLARWHEAVGSYDEEYAYEDLRESFLHQRTIVDVAYAVTPHIASRLRELDPDRQWDVLDELAFVERVRKTPRAAVERAVAMVEQQVPKGMRASMVASLRERHPVVPDDLAAAYRAGVARAKRLAGERWARLGKGPRSRATARDWRRHVRFLREAGWTEEDVRFGVAALQREVDGGALMYWPAPAPREGMRGLTGAPAGWEARTQLAGTEGDRGFRAVLAVAWLTVKVPLETMLKPTRRASALG